MTTTTKREYSTEVCRRIVHRSGWWVEVEPDPMATGYIAIHYYHAGHQTPEDTVSVPADMAAELARVLEAVAEEVQTDGR